MFRRRPLVRAAVVGGTAYYAGKKMSEGRQREAEQEARIAGLEQQQAPPAPAPAAAAPAAGGGMADQITQLKSLLDAGALTQSEFDAAKQRMSELELGAEDRELAAIDNIESLGDEGVVLLAFAAARSTHESVRRKALAAAVEWGQGMNITLVTTATNDRDSRQLLRLMGMPFQKEKDREGNGQG